MLKGLKSYLVTYFLVFLSGLFGFFFLINLFSPKSSGWHIYLILYLSIFLAGSGLGAMLVTAFRYFFGSRVAIFSEKKIIIRQGIFLGILAALGLFLQSQRLLNSLTAVLLVVSLTILELYYLNR